MWPPLGLGKIMSEISLSRDLERMPRTGYNNSKNRELTSLIIYVP
jgi:hypothetical protein